MKKRRRQRREASAFSLSFLDVVCCGFGAVILLFVIALGDQVETEDIDPRADIMLEMAAARQMEIDRLAGEIEALQNAMSELAELKAAALAEKEAWEARLAASRDGLGEKQNRAEALLAERDELERRQEELSGLRIPPVVPQAPTVPVGLPVDSDHIIFVIDTSGSMRAGMFILPSVIQKLDETLQAYPQVRRIQFLNADGLYLISGTDGRWIDDNPQIRNQFLQQVRSAPGSRSNPEGGIAEGIRLARLVANDPSARVAIFVFGDEFDTNPEPAIRRINRMNSEGLTTISAVGFDQRVSPSLASTGLRFVNFMRAVAQENNGAFIGVPAR